MVVYGTICKTSMEKTFGTLSIIFRGTQIFVLKAKKEAVHLQLEIKDIRLNEKTDSLEIHSHCYKNNFIKICAWNLTKIQGWNFLKIKYNMLLDTFCCSKKHKNLIWMYWKKLLINWYFFKYQNAIIDQILFLLEVKGMQTEKINFQGLYLISTSLYIPKPYFALWPLK